MYNFSRIKCFYSRSKIYILVTQNISQKRKTAKIRMFHFLPCNVYLFSHLFIYSFIYLYFFFAFEKKPKPCLHMAALVHAI